MIFSQLRNLDFDTDRGLMRETNFQHGMFMKILLLTVLAHVLFLANYTFVSGSNYWEAIAHIAFYVVFSVNL